MSPINLEWARVATSIVIVVKIREIWYNMFEIKTSGGNMGKISVSGDFQQFCKNLRLSDSVVSNIRSRYRAITKESIRIFGVVIPKPCTASMSDRTEEERRFIQVISTLLWNFLGQSSLNMTATVAMANLHCCRL